MEAVVISFASRSFSRMYSGLFSVFWDIIHISQCERFCWISGLSFLGVVTLPPPPFGLPVETDSQEQTSYSVDDQMNWLFGRWTPVLQDMDRCAQTKLFKQMPVAQIKGGMDIYVYIYIDLRRKKEKRHFLLVTIQQENLMTFFLQINLKLLWQSNESVCSVKCHLCWCSVLLDIVKF